MPFTYTPDMPVASHFPAADQPLMNANSQYLKDFGNRDHEFTQNSTTPGIDGYHKQITFAVNQATPGFTSTSVSVAYANAAGAVPQSQMFFNNAAGNAQLTAVAAAVGPNVAVPTVAANGASFLPGTAALGALLIQWGTDTKSTGQITTFPVEFGAAAYCVVFTPTAITALANGLPLVSAKSSTGFQIGNTTGVAQSYTYNWMAIGLAK